MDNTNLTVRFWGARGSIPSPAPTNARYGGNTACIEVRFGEQLIILDAGSGLRLLGQELLRQHTTGKIEAAILLSHTHWDHIQGLPFFAPAYDGRNIVTLYAAHGRAANVQCALDNQMHPMHFPVGLRQLAALQPLHELPADEVRIGQVFVDTFDLNHPGGCAAFKLKCGQTTIAYLPDHEPYQGDNSGAREKLVAFLHGIDLLILDTQYTAEEYQNRIGWGHGCLTDSVQLARDSQVGRLILFHHDPAHSDEQIDEMLRDARLLANGSPVIIEAAVEGDALNFSSAAGIERNPSGQPTAATPTNVARAEIVRRGAITNLQTPTTTYAS